MSIRFEHATLASKGDRSYQEDSARVVSAEPTSASPSDPSADPSADTAISPSHVTLYGVLADGMGGHAGGALASQLVCEAFLTAVRSDPDPARQRLRSALKSANRALTKAVSEAPHLSGMGTTLVATLFDQNGLHWVSVGDSPLYLVRRGEIALLNEDHSLAPLLDQMAERGEISSERAKLDPRRHMLRSAITGDDLDLVDLYKKPLALQSGDVVVIASDGLNTLEVGEIARLVTAYASDGAHQIARAVLRAVDEAGAEQQDNTTVIIVRVLA